MNRKLMRYITVTVPGWGKHRMFAYAIGDFAAHRTQYQHCESGDLFTVTHIPSGCSVYDEFTSISGAAELADRLSGLDLPTIHMTKAGKPRHDANWRRFKAIVTPVIQEVMLTDAGKA